MFSKVSIFVDSSLKRLTEWMPGQSNNPAWETCFDLIHLFVPLTPYGHHRKNQFKDPKSLLRPLCSKLHEMIGLCHVSPLSQVVDMAQRIEVVIAFRDKQYIWTLSYFLKGCKSPAASITIKMAWDGEIIECEVDKTGLSDFVDFSTLNLRGLTITEHLRRWEYLWSQAEREKLLVQVTGLPNVESVASKSSLTELQRLVNATEMQSILDALAAGRDF
jgi:hypothetical protein